MAKEISDFMDITPDKQRMDSLMVAANIRNLSLLELFYTCVANLCKIMDERGTKIPDEQYHYIKKDDYNKCGKSGFRSADLLSASVQGRSQMAE